MYICVYIYISGGLSTYTLNATTWKLSPDSYKGCGSGQHFHEGQRRRSSNSGLLPVPVNQARMNQNRIFFYYSSSTPSPPSQQAYQEICRDVGIIVYMSVWSVATEHINIYINFVLNYGSTDPRVSSS
eukprot:GHVU01070179.1.p1 GENE.GHVU01070179.1~~GHVU01070179.1.p1  ORF type:complete len:128 (-),score=1.43 GHVU01070179.1:228-611(-)